MYIINNISGNISCRTVGTVYGDTHAAVQCHMHVDAGNI